MRKTPDFRTVPWPTISNGAKDFVKKLLVKEPRARLTAAQALCMCMQNAIKYFHYFLVYNLVILWIWFVAHPWVREGGEASEIPIDISVLNNMRQFVKFSRLKQIALRV